MFGTKRNYTREEINRTYSWAYPEVSKFFENSGCQFLDKPNKGRHALSIYVEDSPVEPERKIITPFRIRLSRDQLVNLHFVLTHEDKEGKVKAFISVLNEVINELYSNGNRVSYIIESGNDGKFHPKRVLKIATAIASRAITYSLDGDYIDTLGELYTVLGERAGTKKFLEDVFNATAKTLEGGDPAIIKSIPDIKCYCCKFCKVGPTGIRTCSKVETAISGQQFDKHPNRYVDAHRKADSGQLVSSVIDKRMDRCKDFIPRAKITEKDK